jgi:putative endonuclease
MEFYTYILQSESLGALYIGSTNNLEDRISRHNRDLNTYTKGKGPWILLFSTTFSTRSQAVQLERFLKSKKSKTRVLAWIASQPR